MSRTRNTDPLHVQATRLPRWAYRIVHTASCRAGGPCTYDPGIVTDAQERHATCMRWPRYYGPSRVGGHRRLQGALATAEHRRARTSERAQLRATTRAANSGPRDALDVHVEESSISRLLR